MRERRRGEVRSCRGSDAEGVTLTQRAEALEGLELRSEILRSVFSKSPLDADWGTGHGRQEPRDQGEATAAMQAGGDGGLDDMAAAMMAVEMVGSGPFLGIIWKEIQRSLQIAH